MKAKLQTFILNLQNKIAGLKTNLRIKLDQLKAKFSKKQTVPAPAPAAPPAAPAAGAEATATVVVNPETKEPVAAPPQASPAPSIGVPAGFLLRFLSRWVDINLLFLLSFFSIIFLKAAGFASTFILPILYFGILHGLTGQTLGKKIMRIKLVEPGGGKVGYPKAFLRALADFLNGLTMGIGYLLAIFTKRKQALHDIVCKTEVAVVSPCPMWVAIVTAIAPPITWFAVIFTVGMSMIAAIAGPLMFLSKSGGGINLQPNININIEAEAGTATDQEDGDEKFPQEEVTVSANSEGINISLKADAAAPQRDIAILEDKSKPNNERWTAAQNLGNAKNAKAVPALSKAMLDTSNDSWIREKSAIALGKIGGNEAVEALKKALQDSYESTMPEVKGGAFQNKPVAEAAAVALRNMGVEGIPAPIRFQKLVAHLKDKDPEVRKAVVSSLWGMGDNGAVEALKPLLNDPNEEVRMNAKGAMKALGFKEQIPTTAAAAPARTPVQVKAMPAQAQAKASPQIPAKPPVKVQKPASPEPQESEETLALAKEKNEMNAGAAALIHLRDQYGGRAKKALVKLESQYLLEKRRGVMVTEYELDNQKKRERFLVIQFESGWKVVRPLKSSEQMDWSTGKIVDIP